MRRALLVPFLLFFLFAGTFDRAKLREIDATVNQAIAAKKIPGGVLWIEHRGHVVRRVYGNRALVPNVEPMTQDTIFDVASMTKVVATAPSIWLLIARGKIGIDDSASRYLPEIADRSITIRHLLTHTSGIRPGLGLKEDWRGYDEGVRRALAETPLNRPGIVFHYSDVNYILLGEIVRRVSGETLDEFARKNIFVPLGMEETSFLPRMSKRRIAPTEQTAEGMLRGVVHDPTARRMGGVAGHAGLFSTSRDLAKFARVVMSGTFFPKGMTEVASPKGVSVLRAAGFDIDSGFSRPRGDLFPLGSFGHTGWTGTFFWIDPSSRTFFVFLSNRVHPDGKGSVTALQRRLGTLVAESLRDSRFVRQPRRVGFIIGGADAQNGIDVLHASGYAALRGLKVGLITNQSGIDRSGNPTIDLLRSAPGVTLVSLFSPEHGIRGVADDTVNDSVDEVSGLPIYSLYGQRKKPTPEQLAGLDALVFDVQDIGTRFYTYITTMGLAMEAAADAKIRFVVLDRVNPIGGTIVEGPVSEPPWSFTNYHPLPVRHGKTVGELAMLFRDEKPIAVDLTVIPVKGWSREQWQDEAGLPWVNTSPNMRSLDAAALYPGIGLLESALSVGRGTPTPFEIIGAPYIDGERLAAALRDMPGVAVTPVRFTPTASIHKGEECRGIRITITDRRALRSVTLGLTIARLLATWYPDAFPVEKIEPLLRNPEAFREILPVSAPRQSLVLRHRPCLREM